MFEGRFSRVMVGAAAMCTTAMLVAGCASMKPEDSDKWRESQKPVIEKRVEARWKAMIDGDLEKAYGYSTPEYRAVVTLQQYKGRYGRVLEWLMARVQNISYDSPTVASVSVDVTYRASIMGSMGKPIETNKLLTEKWLFKGGEWWYTNQ